MSRCLPVALTVLLSSLPARAAPASPEQEAAVLVEQGDRLMASGRPEVALELYRAAALLSPDAAAPHLGAARVLRAQGRCQDAVPEYRAWMSLTPQPPSAPELYTEAVIELGQCLRESAATLEIQSQRAFSCAVDGGAPRPVTPDAPVSFELSPGAHTVTCGDDLIAPLSFPAGGRRLLRIDAQGRLVSLVTLRSDVPARCTLDGGPAFDVTTDGAQWLVAPGEHHLDCTRDGQSPTSQPLVVEVAGEHDVSLVAAAPTVIPGEEPWPPAPKPPGDLPSPSPQPRTPPAPRAPVSTRAELEVKTEQTGWTCRIGGFTRTPDIAGELFVDLDAGDYVLECDNPRALTVTQPLTLAAGERVIVDVVWTPRATPAVEEKPVRASLLPGGVEWMIGAGLGPSLGTFGLAVGGRIEAWSVELGTGVNPLALSVTYHLKPGANGMYLQAGWTRVGDGFLRGGDAPAGNGVHAAAGIELRFVERFLVRLGAGLAAASGFGSGPLTFDLSGYWLP